MGDDPNGMMAAKWTRRRFMGVLGGTLAALTLDGVPPALRGAHGQGLGVSMSQWEAEDIGEGWLHAPPAKLPTETATLMTDLFMVLGHVWQLVAPAEAEGRRALFQVFLQAKTEQAPSYYAEYANAAQLMAARTAKSGHSALQDLLLEPSRLAAEPHTRLAHFRRYVVQEFAEFHLIHGGFRVFGYQNFPGYMGGPLTTHPYR